MYLPDKLLWVEALKTELNDETSRGLIIETTLPKGSKPVGNSVQYNSKSDSNGKLIKNKICICAQGYSQKHVVDYNDTFSPTGKFNSKRSGTTSHGCSSSLSQSNIKNKIFMKIPNFSSTHSSGKVWQLTKPLYGLKQ
ncbi:hypothetical protein O181_012540 [Austropuccinia psidii MF-1]|uniref:Reverse transcriptase Ty1/copia-type domain-containing protein n=1 Tax=Austropuccinia psidii MF-1 TaxID=1389203 RepID=A0A9Q3GN18_9BASI|nr:hypothetical protein [Austropuccinia psidii MF-1]